MIRRWSYLNTLNLSWCSSFSSLQHVKHDLTIRHNLYYKKNYLNVSRISRRAWVKRRRINNFSIYRNVLADWSSEYLFLRKYARFAYVYGLFSSSILAQNFIAIKNRNPATYVGMEQVYSSTIVKSLIRYYSARGNLQLRFLSSYSHTLWIYLTAPQLPTLLKAQSKLTYWSFFQVYGHSLTPAKLNLIKVNMQIDIQRLISDLVLVKLGEIYKLFTYLTLLTL